MTCDLGVTCGRIERDRSGEGMTDKIQRFVLWVAFGAVVAFGFIIAAGERIAAGYVVESLPALFVLGVMFLLIAIGVC